MTSMVMNDHSWYTLNSPLDWVRAALWCGTNFITFVSYFMIPFEIYQWGSVVRFTSTTVIGALFIWFIILCGLSHLAMLFIMQTGPWWATLLIYLPMAVVSAATMIVLRQQRQAIITALDRVTKALWST
jgi:hypothetical protein